MSPLPPPLPLQRLADSDGGDPVASTSTSTSSAPPIATAARTYRQASPRQEDELMTLNQLRVEMETLLSLRRHSMNQQPLTLDPDLPPTIPPTSSPPTATSPNPASSHPHQQQHSPPPPPPVALATATQRDPNPSSSSSSTSRNRPHLTLQLAPPVLNESPSGPGAGGGAGPPVSPTAPTPAETGTLVRRKSSSAHKLLPSEHPLPVPPLPSPTTAAAAAAAAGGLHFPPSPFGAGASSSSLSPTSAAFPSQAGPSTSPPPTSPTSPSSSYLDIPLSSLAPSSGGGGDLFWLPASLHPELAPQEFKAFIREQTTPEALARRSSLGSHASSPTAAATAGPGETDATSAGGGGGAGRSGANRISRRASLLRGEYKPRQGDGVGDDAASTTTELKRTTSEGNRAAAGMRWRSGGDGYYRRGSVVNFEQLTIKDLQRLEELAAKAEAEGTTAGEEEEGERLGRVLRRSLSLNPHRVAAAAAEAERLEHLQQQQQSDRLSALTEEEPGGGGGGGDNDDEAPLIVPPPGQILRRNARTRIRKTSTGSEIGARGGSGSRFGGPRRPRTSTGGESVDSSTGSGGAGAADWSASGGYGGTVEDDGTGSTGDHSVEDSVVSYESDDAVVGRSGLRAPPSSVESAVSESATTAGVAYASVVPVSSPTSSENQHIEFSDQAGFGLGHNDADVVRSDVQAQGTPALGSEPVVTPSPATREPALVPTAPPASAVSPASADYDWATQNLQGGTEAPPQPQLQPRPPPAPEPQYLVHPQHLSRQPFSEVPPVQAVPLPTHEPAAPSPSASPSLPPRADSPKPAGKKSGWARLGLGRDDDKGKKKGRGSGGGGGSGSGGKEGHHGSPGKDASPSSSSGFLGGLFGRKHREEHDRPPPRAPSPPVAAEPKIPPPPPTASGVLLPNGRYANFYRLPIHVERAVYRLSHIKLANPRRPLYEQVLISNLMFWYLGLIQKPTTPPPPAAPPVPIPGMRAQQQQAQPPPPVAPLAVPVPAPVPKDSPKRNGLSKPGRGGRTAETPVRGTSFEVQNQQLVEEQQQQHRYQQQQQQRQQPSYTPLQQTSNTASSGRSPPTSPPGKGIFAPPLSSSKTVEPPLSSRSPERASAPASLYPISSAHPTSYDSGVTAGAMDWQYEQDAPHRESYPPNRPLPVATDTVHVDSNGFEVVSRSPPAAGRRLSGGSSHGGEAAFFASSAPNSSHPNSTARERRASTMSDKSFDASEIYDAYAPLSPDNATDPFLSGTGSPAGPERPAGLVLGAVAPRGSSLKALSGSDP
ncbi:hypothetical protein JCM3774_003533 [Rhodotorula dairenensis]